MRKAVQIHGLVVQAAPGNPQLNELGSFVHPIGCFPRQSRPKHINDLSDDLLLCILKFVPQPQNMWVRLDDTKTKGATGRQGESGGIGAEGHVELCCPLVCKRWRDVLRVPSAVWEQCSFNFSVQSAGWQPVLAFHDSGASGIAYVASHSVLAAAPSLLHMDREMYTTIAGWFEARGRSMKRVELITDEANAAGLSRAILPHFSAFLEKLLVYGNVPAEALNLLSQYRGLQELRLNTWTSWTSWQEFNPAPLPPVITTLTSLTCLYASGFNDMPQNLAALSNLIRLDIPEYCGSSFPTAVLQLTGLTHLRLGFFRHPSNSGFRPALIVPAAVTGLQRLTELVLSGCVVEHELSVPLRVLQMQSCAGRVTEVPGYVRTLTSLEKLSLSFNKIAQISSWISVLQNLVELDFAFNPITHVPSAITALTSLTSLRMSVEGERPLTIPLGITKLTNLKQFKLNSMDVKLVMERRAPIRLRMLTGHASSPFAEFHWENRDRTPRCSFARVRPLVPSAAVAREMLGAMEYILKVVKFSGLLSSRVCD